MRAPARAPVATSPAVASSCSSRTTSSSSRPTTLASRRSSLTPSPPAASALGGVASRASIRSWARPSSDSTEVTGAATGATSTRAGGSSTASTTRSPRSQRSTSAGTNQPSPMLSSRPCSSAQTRESDGPWPSSSPRSPSATATGPPDSSPGTRPGSSRASTSTASHVARAPPRPCVPISPRRARSPSSGSRSAYGSPRRSTGPARCESPPGVRQTCASATGHARARPLARSSAPVTRAGSAPIRPASTSTPRRAPDSASTATTCTAVRSSWRSASSQAWGADSTDARWSKEVGSRATGPRRTSTRLVSCSSDRPSSQCDMPSCAMGRAPCAMGPSWSRAVTVGRCLWTTAPAQRRRRAATLSSTSRNAPWTSTARPSPRQRSPRTRRAPAAR